MGPWVEATLLVALALCVWWLSRVQGNLKIRLTGNALGVALLVGTIVVVHLARGSVFPFEQWNMYVGRLYETTVRRVVAVTDEGSHHAVRLGSLYPSLDHSRADMVLRKLVGRRGSDRQSLVRMLRSVALRWELASGAAVVRVEVWESDADSRLGCTPGTKAFWGRRALWVDI